MYRERGGLARSRRGNYAQGHRRRDHAGRSGRPAAPNEIDRRQDTSISGSSSLLTLKSREPVTIPSPLVVRWKSSENLTDWTDITAGVQYISGVAADTGFVTRSYRYTAPGNPQSLFIRRAVVKP